MSWDRVTAVLGERRNFLAAVAVILAAGLAFRALHLLGGRFLWLDELHLAPNVLARGFPDLAQPLVNNQIAPLGFLVVSKLFSLLPVAPEVSLRLWSFAISVPALICFPALVLRAGGTRFAAVFALAVIALFLPFVWHDAEFKQYAGEFAFTVFASLACFAVLDSPTTGRRALFFGVGLLACVFAVSAPFILGPLGLLVAWHDLAARRWRALAASAAMAAVWSALYLSATLAILDTSTEDFMQGWWTDEFLPLPIRFYSLTWLFDHAYRFFAETAGFRFAGGLALLFCLVGAHDLLSNGRWRAFAVLAGPAAAALLTSCAQIYPFVDRLVHFATPGMIALVGIGVGAFAQALRPAPVAVMLLAAVMLLPGLRTTVGAAFPTVPYFERDGAEVLLSAIAADRAPDDIIYAAGAGARAVERFVAREGIHDPHFVAGGRRIETDRLFADIARFEAEGSRVWFLLANRAAPNSLANQWILDDMLARMGRIVERRERNLAVALLVDFGGANAATSAVPQMMSLEPAH